jgi:hypothetical protein
MMIFESTPNPDFVTVSIFQLLNQHLVSNAKADIFVIDLTNTVIFRGKYVLYPILFCKFSGLFYRIV